jgi:predicted pyridoxine 5'-phosphate oxidase superfamily flavin-nucleotide-binding protein
MAYPFGSLVFTPVVKELQERYGSRRSYAKREGSRFSQDALGPDEEGFLAECDSFYMASIGESGWPYVQHRGGPRGFLKVLDEHTIGFADFRGNRQYISAGNLMTNDKVALILVDYPKQARLKILGHVQIYEDADAKEWIEKLRESGEATPIERVFIIHVDAFDWNCQQHITRRFTEEQIRNALDPLEKRMQQLVMENEKLRAEIARVQENNGTGMV